MLAEPIMPEYHSWPIRLFALAMALTTAVSSGRAQTDPAARHLLGDSIKMPSVSLGANITRLSLTAEDFAQNMNFSVSLKMRNFTGLEARISQGQKISADDMEANYLPALSDYAAVRDWLVGQGFTLTQEDPNHTTIFALGSVAQLQAALDVAFAKVNTADGEFISAITAPSLPKEIAGAVSSIDGLQPHIRMHHHASRNAPFSPQSTPVFGSYYLGPADILAAYGAPSNLTGAGQTIAIIMGAGVSVSDFNAFFATVQPQRFGTITEIPVLGGPTISSFSADSLEAAADVEWSAGIAPGANIRLYVTPDLSLTSAQAAWSQILADASAYHITVVSMSFGAPEYGNPVASMISANQTVTLLVNKGITVLASSGDGGSNPYPASSGYNPSNPFAVSYPASDPYVVGVGGTLLAISSPVSSNYVNEVAYNFNLSGNNEATGGGYSSVFFRPAWQAEGPILAASPVRCVPDVAMIFGGEFATGQPVDALVVLNGAPSSFLGTSLGCPIWAGIVAMLNEGRANANLNTIGLLGPTLYSLYESNAFHYNIGGNNGGYFAQTGYDLCTGLGSPIISNFIADLTPPTITSAAAVTGVAGNSFSYFITATGSPTSFNATGLPSGLSINTSSGAISGIPTVVGTSTVRLSATNSFGTGTATLILTIASLAPPPVSSSGASSGGGGGAPSPWFYGALFLLSAIRFNVRQGRQPPDSNVGPFRGPARD